MIVHGEPCEQPRHLSPSSIGTWQKCPLQYRYSRIDKVPEPSTKEQILGSYTHEVLEVLYGLPAEDRTLAQAKRLCSSLWAEKWGAQVAELGLSAEEERKFRWQVWWCIEALWKLENPAEVKLAGIEQKLETTLGSATLLGIIDRWQQLEDGTALIGDYKGLALDTPIPTPSGWTTMGALAVGDTIVGGDGHPCRVILKSDIRKRPCYRLTFDDGTSVVADDEHRWLVRCKGVESIMTTAEVARQVFGPKQRQLSISLVPAIHLPQVDLPLDPYVLGVWLGDGKHTDGSISGAPLSGVWDQISKRGYAFGTEMIDQRNGCRSSTVLGIRGHLGALNVLGNKHIPEMYLRASKSQRLDLLRGLMDADGSWNVARRQAVFSNTNKALVYGLYELLVTLGEKPKIHEIKATGFGLTIRAYHVTFSPLHFNPFAVDEKASKVNVRNTGHNSRRLVRSVELTETVPTQCIGVDSPNNTYLCTESMVITHNTGKAAKPKYQAEKRFQLGVYTLLIENVLDIEVSAAELLYLKEGIRWQIKPTDELRTLVKDTVNTVWGEIGESCESGRFKATTSILCDWCAYKKNCPAWKVSF